MEGMSKEFAPIGEQLPAMINETISESKIGGVPNKILEKMEKTIDILNEQTDYEDPSSTTVIVPVPTSSQPSVNGGGGGGTTMVPIGPSTRDTLNKYMEAIIQKALF